MNINQLNRDTEELSSLDRHRIYSLLVGLNCKIIEHADGSRINLDTMTKEKRDAVLLLIGELINNSIPEENRMDF
jgi:hypothetical protein